MKSFAIAFFVCCGLASFAHAQASHSGLDLKAIDKSVDPCSDFYRYACGTWIKNNPIPADESSWGRFNELHDRNQAELRKIAEDAAQHQDRSELDQKVGGYYASCMNEAEIEKLGRKPLKPELDRIAQIGNPQQLLDEVARLQDQQVDVFFGFGPSPDPNNARMEIAALDQGGLGLPERDFYLRTDPKSKEIQKKYVAHIAQLFQLIGDSQAEAQKKADAVMALETNLAKASLDVTSRRNPKLLVHIMPKSDLKQLSPNFDFPGFFEKVNTPEFQKLNVAVPDFLKALSEQMSAQSMSDLKDYLAYHYINANASLLSKNFVDANFDFYGRTLRGTKEIKPRWKRCISATDGELGEALGQKFVDKTFGTEGKQKTLQLVNEIEHQMANDIQSLTWMSPSTKKEAMVKLKAVTNKIGYPDKWRDYSSIKIISDDYFGNSIRANQFESRRLTRKIGQPVDRKEWGMTPPTVNAYYDPTENNINFPAGILQPPFYSNKATDAVNYGGIGMVVGHELTHGFDDEGRQFDADGNLKDWWQKSDAVEYDKLSNCIVGEYSGFSPEPGVHLNGKLTLGENTADNGGIRLAYFALMDDLAKKSLSPALKVDNYTQAQQFFLGNAQVWCEKQTPESTRLRAQTDPHSMGQFRVNGVVSNMPEFSEAFGCKVGDKMYAAKGCRVW